MGPPQYICYISSISSIFVWVLHNATIQFNAIIQSKATTRQADVRAACIRARCTLFLCLSHLIESPN